MKRAFAKMGAKTDVCGALKRALLQRLIAIGIAFLTAHSMAGWCQEAAPPSTAAPAQAPANTTTTTGGTLHGVIKSGNIPLPGVAVTATNTLTGKRYERLRILPARGR